MIKLSFYISINFNFIIILLYNNMRMKKNISFFITLRTTGSFNTGLTIEDPVLNGSISNMDNQVLFNNKPQSTIDVVSLKSFNLKEIDQS